MDFRNKAIASILTKRFPKESEDKQESIFDVFFIYGGIHSGLENKVKHAIQIKGDKKNPYAAILINTLGGNPFVAEQIIQRLHLNYEKVFFVINDKAMSAGTIMAMAGNEIIMSKTACLGPIDVQIQRGDKYIPAASYLDKFEELYKKAEDPRQKMNTADLILLEKFDPAELKEYQESMDLGKELVKEWLVEYKFASWKKENKYKARRAKKIAEVLSQHSKWHAHARPISRERLESGEINLKICHLEDINELEPQVSAYESLVSQWGAQYPNFLHSFEFF